MIKENINYNPTNGVTSSVTLNWEEEWVPDYVFVADEDTIISSWFVADFVRTRNGQYTAALKRDTINDFFQNVVTATTYIEKATIKDTTNPLIFNSEGMVLNQIKMQENLLKDPTNSAWIVGYVSRGQPTAPTTISTFAGGRYDTTIEALSTNVQGALPARETTTTSHTSRGSFNTLNFILQLKGNNNIWKYGEVRVAIDANGVVTPQEPFLDSLKRGELLATYNKPVKQAAQEYVGRLETKQTELAQSLPIALNTLTFAEELELINLNGKILRDTLTGKNYLVSITSKASASITQTITKTSALGAVFYSAIGNDGSPGSGPIECSGSVREYNVSLQPTAEGVTSVIINPNHTHCEDAPYDLFAIPYHGINVYLGPNNEFEVDANISVDLAQQISSGLGTGDVVYDLQLLPYCPLTTIYLPGGGINLVELSEGMDYNLVKEGTTNRSVVIWCNKSRGNLVLPYVKNPTDVKLDNETRLTRICSPNYNGAFDFNIAKNGGVSYMNVDFTYKPYNPYIHINPNFGGLYGQNFGDGYVGTATSDIRGLTCGGDFSLASVKDAWRTYELNNKNYQAIFDRQIQNLDTTHKYDQMENIIGGILGTGAGFLGGAMIGYSGFNVNPGMAGGIGAGVSGVGAIADIAVSEGRHKEAKSYATDLYNYNLGNIKALPYSISKTTALTNNNKLWPFVEEYDCTEAEKEALRNKLKYNGMTVMVIDKLDNYIYAEPTFVQGQVIRIEGLSEDNHLAMDIYNEIKRGVFIGREAS